MTTVGDIETAARTMCGASDAAALLDSSELGESALAASFAELSLTRLLEERALALSPVRPKEKPSLPASLAPSPRSLWKEIDAAKQDAAGSKSRPARSVVKPFEPAAHLAISAACAAAVLGFVENAQEGKPEASQFAPAAASEASSAGESQAAPRVPSWMTDVDVPAPPELLQQSLTASTARDSCRVESDSS